MAATLHDSLSSSTSLDPDHEEFEIASAVSDSDMRQTEYLYNSNPHLLYGHNGLGGLHTSEPQLPQLPQEPAPVPWGLKPFHTTCLSPEDVQSFVRRYVQTGRDPEENGEPDRVNRGLDESLPTGVEHEGMKGYRMNNPPVMPVRVYVAALYDLLHPGHVLNLRSTNILQSLQPPPKSVPVPGCLEHFDTAHLTPEDAHGYMRLHMQTSNDFDYNPHETGCASGFVRDWRAYPGMSPIYRPPCSGLKATSTHTRTRNTPRRHHHHQYSDSLLLSKCPKSRIHALNVAIQFREVYGADELIPNNLLDELLEPTGDGKYIFCCQRAQKARNIAGARDLVRKSLGNFPFRCSNLGCEHSSLRQADLNKHMKICKRPALTFSPNISWGIENTELSAQDPSASTSSMPLEQSTVPDPYPLLNITSGGEDGMGTYPAFPSFGDESEARINGVE